MHSTRHAVIVGAGRIGKLLIADLPESWGITVIDLNESALEQLPEEHGKLSVNKLVGDATSRMVLEKAHLESSTVLAVTTHDDHTNAEIVRMARTHFGVEEIVCLFQDQNNLECQNKNLLLLNLF